MRTHAQHHPSASRSSPRSSRAPTCSPIGAPVYSVIRSDSVYRAHYYLAHFVLGHILSGDGRFDEAIAAHRRAIDLSGSAPLLLGWLGLTLAQSGSTAEARAVLERLHTIAPNAYVPPTSFTWIHLGLGETGHAFTWLNRAVDARDHMLMPIKSFWFLDSIRADRRYAALLRRIKLER